MAAIPCVSWLDAWLNFMKLSLNEIQSKQKPGKYPCIVITVSHNYPVLLPEDCFPGHGRGKAFSTTGRAGNTIGKHLLYVSKST